MLCKVTLGVLKGASKLNVLLLLLFLFHCEGGSPALCCASGPDNALNSGIMSVYITAMTPNHFVKVSLRALK